MTQPLQPLALFHAMCFAGLTACSVQPSEPWTLPIEPYDPLPLVDPFIGTGGLGAGVGSITPGATVPFGMTRAGPDTRGPAGAPGFYHCAGYYYDDTHIDGFSHTHAHGMGVADYGGVHVIEVQGPGAGHGDVRFEHHPTQDPELWVRRFPVPT